MDIDVIVERRSFDVELEIGNPVVEAKAPDRYNGPFDIFPSDEDQIIPVKEKMPVEDICVKGAEGSLEITTNGTYSVVGKKNVVVNNPEEWTTEGFLDLSQPSGSFTLDHLTIPSFLFANRYNVTDIYAPNATVINECAFRSCSGLQNVHFPNANRFYDYVLADCSNLERVCFPNLVNAGKYVFLNNTSLNEFHAPKAAALPQSCLQGCISLEFLYIPSQKTTGTNTFNGCTNLNTLILPSLTSYGGQGVFANCPNLKTVLFGLSASLVRNENINNWSNTPFAQGGSGGEIYIPKVLYDHLGDGSSLDYEAANNWKTMIPWGTIHWKQIEGSEYETYMPGGEKYNEEMALTA